MSVEALDRIRVELGKIQIGDRYGFFRVERVQSRSQVHVRCICGVTRIVSSQKLRDGEATCCQLCSFRRRGIFPPHLGQRFGRLLVGGRCDRRSTIGVWCDCGNRIVVNALDLEKGRVTMCPQCRAAERRRSARSRRRSGPKETQEPRVTVQPGRRVGFYLIMALEDDGRQATAVCLCGRISSWLSVANLQKGKFVACPDCGPRLRGEFPPPLGKRFGNLTALESQNRDDVQVWCECGVYTSYTADELESGDVVACAECTAAGLVPQDGSGHG